jgi:hypothetical protein
MGVDVPVVSREGQTITLRTKQSLDKFEGGAYEKSASLLYRACPWWAGDQKEALFFHNYYTTTTTTTITTTTITITTTTTTTTTT